jgi:excisionase family DNA binding protein
MALDYQGYRFYTILEASRVLQITPATVRRYVKAGRLSAQRVGRPLLIPEGSLKAFLGLTNSPTSENITLQK